MHKYSQLRDRLDLEIDGIQISEAQAATDAQLELVHSKEYIQGIATGGINAAMQREIGFPWSPAMAQRARHSVGATIAAARIALAEGLAGNIAGGTHHSYADKGGGFCVFNDIAVAARQLQTESWHLKNRKINVAVIDLDVHQGNGTAHIFSNDTSVFTLSLHGEKNFPFRKESSDLDVGLPDGCTDETYLKALSQSLRNLEERFEPDLVFYLAGADPHEGDRLGRLKLSYTGMRLRDLAVMNWTWEKQLPVVLCMGGGYGHDISTTLAVQMQTWHLAISFWKRWQEKLKTSARRA
jgi:acetoin utilization deacetylase AcuC-like enzyme